MSNNAEQYTVKTPEEILKSWISKECHNLGDYESIFKYYEPTVVKAIREYSSELIKENERLKASTGAECLKALSEAREENKLYREALTEAKGILQWHLDNSKPCYQVYQSDFFNLTANAITQADSALSKFQPKKDESIK